MQKKRIPHFIRHLFRIRRVLVVTEQGVNYYPLGRSTQLLSFLAVIGFISWASYSTGSFMAAESIIEEKEQRIAVADEENRKIGSRFSLLKRDLVRLSQEEDQELSEYTRFVIDQYADEGSEDGVGKNYAEGISEENKAIVLERLQFLEDRVEQLKQKNYALIEAVRLKTQEKVGEYEDIINMTGLSSTVLEQRKAAMQQEMEETPRGGPYIPESVDEFQEQEKALFASIDRLVLLAEITEMLPLGRAMENSRLTSGYGRRIDPFTKRPARHLGLDFAGAVGARALATSDGVVVSAGRHGAYGNLVEIDHGLGITTRYGHLSKIFVKKGTLLRQGDALGVQGSTGRSTGQHLHYEVRYNDKPINPYPFLKAGAHVSSQ